MKKFMFWTLVSHYEPETHRLSGKEIDSGTAVNKDGHARLDHLIFLQNILTVNSG